jgi:branched-chain amino acid transport system substrate-binding protein
MRTMKWCVSAFVLVAAFPSAAHAQVTVYSSMPLNGASRVQTKAVNDGARRALRDSGVSSITLKRLNNATKRAGTWMPGPTRANARRAAKDARAIAYIGEFNSGASRISIPILNRAGVPMVSPSNTFNGLTDDASFYPTGVRTFFRIVPNDHVQAAALVTAMRDRGCRQLGLVHDNEVYGKGMNTDAAATAARLGLPVVANVRISRRAPKAMKNADCVAYTGITANGAVPLFRSRALKGKRLFGSDGVAESSFASRVGRRVTLTVATLTPSDYGFAGKDPYYAFGYEAMKLIADGIKAGAADRTALTNWLHSVQNRQSVLGTYGFDANGDTTLRSYGLYVVEGKELRFDRAITAA